jgi:hypothetical protein
MTTNLASVVRIEQTHREFERLSRDIEVWLNERVRADKHQQYHTQLKVLHGVLKASLQRLRCEFASLARGATTAAVFARCRWFEKQLVWIQRLWGYFRTKFDQRDDDVMGRVLGAADEIVWSCYAEVYRATDLDQPPAPLPYIEPLFSPQAVPRADPPPDLRTDVDADFLFACLKQLPIPLVSSQYTAKLR